MADIKHRGGKWVLVSDEKDSKGHPKKEEKYDTKEEAEKALKRWEGQKYHAEGKKPVKGSLEVVAKEDKYDVKKMPSGKWTVVDEHGKKYHNAGDYTTEKEAVERLREMAGWEAHSKGKSKKHAELLNILIKAADALDSAGHYSAAKKVDSIIDHLTKE